MRNNKLGALARDMDAVLARQVARGVFLATPLVNGAWDGDSYSTTAKAIIDLSAAFGVPAGVKAVLVRTAVRDSASAGMPNLDLCLSPNSTSLSGLFNRCSGLPNDYYSDAVLTVPCDANGDIYYQIRASGASTMDIYIEIWGYWL